MQVLVNVEFLDFNRTIIASLTAEMGDYLIPRVGEYIELKNKTYEIRQIIYVQKVAIDNVEFTGQKNTGSILSPACSVRIFVSQQLR